MPINLILLNALIKILELKGRPEDLKQIEIKLLISTIKVEEERTKNPLNTVYERDCE